MKKLLIPICLLLISCNHLKEGRIIIKQFTPAHSYVQTRFIYCGKVMIPTRHTVYVDDRYEIFIKGVTDGDSITETHEINKYEFQSMQVGENVKVE